MLFLKFSALLKQYRRTVESSPWSVEASAEARASDCSRQTARPGPWPTLNGKCPWIMIFSLKLCSHSWPWIEFCKLINIFVYITEQWNLFCRKPAAKMEGCFKTCKVQISASLKAQIVKQFWRLRSYFLKIAKLKCSGMSHLPLCSFTVKGQSKIYITLQNMTRRF